MVPGQVSDRAQRVSDTVNNHLVGTLGGAAGRWVAVRLSDGTSDGQLYDTKSDAVRHQLHETQCAYICITPDGMSPSSAALYLRFTEGLYAAGARVADPDTHVPMPARREQVPGLIRAVARRR